MIIGVPRERKTLEKRVAITPDNAHELAKRGHAVLIETSAGEGSHFPDADYRAAGCEIVAEMSDVWSRAELIVKVKEPHESEYRFFRPGVAVFDYLHLAGLPELARVMLREKVTGIAYELVQTEDRRLPLLEPMSEVAGKLAVQNGAYFLQAQNGGRGLLLGGVIGVEPAKVAIIGAGVAGHAACEAAVGLGASVSILDIDHTKLEKIHNCFGSRVVTLHSTYSSIAREAQSADLLIGAVLVPGAAAPRLITREMIKSMKKGAVFVDISIDQGGCAETNRTTSLADPVFELDGVIHYGVPNIPAQTPRTSTLALTAATLPYLLRLAEKGIAKCLKEDRQIRNALNTYMGKLTNKAVSEAVGVEYSPVDGCI